MTGIVRPAALLALLGIVGGCTDPVSTGQGAADVRIAPANPSVRIGMQIAFVASPGGRTSPVSEGVTWASSDTAVVTVNSATGLAHARKIGTATIAAMTDAGKAHATSVVTVDSTYRGLNMPARLTLETGNAVQLTAEPASADGTRPDLGPIVYSSSDTSVVRVNRTTGAVLAVGPGTVSVRAGASHYPGIWTTTSILVGTQHLVSMPVLGRGIIAERYTAEIAAANGYAYTTTWGARSFEGTVNNGNVVNVWSVPGDTPLLVDTLRIANATTTSDVQISPDGSLLVVSTEGASAGSILIYSLADPAHPRFLTRFQTSTTARGVHTVKLGVISGRLYAFLQIDPPGGVLIADITDPLRPREMSYTPMSPSYAHDVFVRDGYLFTALMNGGLSIYDIGGGNAGGTVSSPALLGNVKTATGRIHNVWWVHDPATGSRRYVVLGEEGPGSGSLTQASGDIHVIDVSSMSAPVQVATYSVPQAGAHNFYVDEQSQVLYAAYYNGGVRALDVRGDLGNCEAAARVPAGNYAGMCDLRKMGREVGVGLTSGAYVWGVTMQGSRIYASDMKTGIVVLDASGLKR